jgi:predicted metal-dependent enzyme (double-stranded beta helix superfamily)
MLGHDSGIHDHDISSGAVHVVEGELCEERVSWDGAPDAMRYGPGQSFDFGPSDVHRIVHAGTQPTVAIHVYSPPLRNQGVYSRGDRGQLQRHPLDHGAEVKPPVAAG